MNLASEFANCSLDEIKELLNGGTLTVYSVARPLTADLPVDRSGVLATFTFATPAFGPADGEYESPNFEANPVTGTTVGTPGFLRARKADGTTVADFSAGPGDREIKFTEVSVSRRRARAHREVSLQARRLAGAPRLLRHQAALRLSAARQPLSWSRRAFRLGKRRHDDLEDGASHP